MEEELTFAGYSQKYPRLPIALDGIGIRHLQEHIDRPSGIGSWQWVQCVEGKGELIFDGNTYLVEKGCGMFLPGNTTHIYYGLTKQWYVNFLCFNGAIIPELMALLGLDKPGVYRLSDPQNILDQERQIYDLYKANPMNNVLEASKLIYSLLLDLTSDIIETGSGQKTTQNEKIHQVICYMYEHYSQPISLSDIAASVGLSKEYLCQIFKSNMDCTMLDYLVQIRMASAKTALIKYPEKTIAEVSKMCGFDTPSYFCAVFKKYERMTPGSFRESRK